MSLVSDIKLIRTDTTHDLSQKAEKGMGEQDYRVGLYIPQCGAIAILATNMGEKENCLPFLPLCFFLCYCALECSRCVTQVMGVHSLLRKLCGI